MILLRSKFKSKKTPLAINYNHYPVVFGKAKKFVSAWWLVDPMRELPNPTATPAPAPAPKIQAAAPKATGAFA
jgi:hypothetical protein